jgi:hypothetical protein
MRRLCKGLIVLLGCSGVIAIPFFAIAFVGTLIFRHVDGSTFGERLSVAVMSGVMVAATAFIAAFYLGVSDQLHNRSTIRAVRNRLAIRDEQDDEFFAANWSNKLERDIAIRLRTRLATYFNVDPNKIHRDDSLDAYHFDQFMPQIYAYIASEFLSEQQWQRWQGFPKLKLFSISDLIGEAKLMLAAPDADGSKPSNN